MILYYIFLDSLSIMNWGLIVFIEFLTHFDMI